MDTNKDYYKILSVSPSIEEEALKAVYRALAKKYHPDTTTTTSTSEIFRDIQEAFDVLSDPDLRKIYDGKKFEDAGIEEEAPKKNKKANKNKTTPPNSGSSTVNQAIVISFALVFLIILVALFGSSSGIIGQSKSPQSEVSSPVENKEIPPGPLVYHDFPQIVNDLKKVSQQTNFIKLKMVVEIATRDLPLLVAHEMEILDRVKGYLRSQTRSELAGTDGVKHMRGDIDRIIHEVMAPVEFQGVLFREILLQ